MFDIHENKSKKCILEDLPNELLIFIFGYLSAFDLYESLFHLNYRFNQICFQQKLHLDLSLRQCLTDYYCLNQHLFQLNTFSIELNRSVSTIHFDCFVNLRRLIVKDGSLRDFNENVFISLNKLEHLSYLKTYCVLIEHGDDVLPILKLKSLKSLTFHSFEPIPFANRIENEKLLPQLEYLCVDGCYVDDFFRMLEHFDSSSSLKRINVFLIYEQKYGELSSSSLFHFYFDSVVNIEFTFNYLSFDNFQSILRCFPNLKYLKFSNLTNQFDYLSSQKWNSLICSNLLQLIQLKFYIRIENEVERPTIDFLRSFYELNQQWLNGLIVMDFHSKIKPKSIEFYTSSQHLTDGKSSTEFYGKQRFIIGDSTKKDFQFNKTIKHLKLTLTDDFNFNDQYEIYPKIESIHIHSQFTNSQYSNSKLIVSDLVRSIPNRNQVTMLDLTSQSSQNLQSNVIVDLFNEMTNISTLRLTKENLFDLIECSFIRTIFSQRIQSLTIRFGRNSLTFNDFIEIDKVFSKTLHFLYIEIDDYGEFDENLHLFFSILFSSNWKELYQFNLRFARQQTSTFQSNFYELIEKQKQIRKSIEYSIKNQQFSIYF